MIALANGCCIKHMAALMLLAQDKHVQPHAFGVPAIMTLLYPTARMQAEAYQLSNPCRSCPTSRASG